MTLALGMWLCAFALLMPGNSASAQSRAARALRAVRVERSDTGWIFELEFEFAVQYLRHSPQGVGRLLRISVNPVEFGENERLRGPLREVLPIPKGQPSPLLEIAYDGSFGEKPVVEMQFGQDLEFRVERGKRSQMIRIHAELPGSASASPSTPQSTSLAVTPDDSRAGQFLTRARHAVRDGELDLAIALLTRVLELPEEESALQTRMDSRELIAITHERRGQLAHAQAEYEAYLEDYPDGPAASRVQQRLDALLTASAAPKQPLRRPNKARSSGTAGESQLAAIERDVFGSMAVRYYRFEALSDESGADFLATDILTDIDLAGRLEADTWSVRGDFTGTYDKDIAGEGRDDDARISRLSIHVEDRIHHVEATIGRQRRSDSGVLGRFDGLRLAADFLTHFSVSGLVGLPVESTSNANPNTDTILAGGAIDIKDFWIPGLQGQFFAVGQNTSSLTDRAAIGGEIRYSGEQTYSFLYLDYDVMFESLNTFIVSGNYRLSQDTDFRLLVERRNTPILTLQVALQGQPVSDLDGLRDLFSTSEIRDLAKDRTSASWSGSIGATHRPNEKYQISSDLTVAYLGKTKTSGGVTGSDAFGPDVGATVQLVVNDWLVDGGIGSLSLRYFNGDSFDSFVATGYSRFSLAHNVRLLPRLRWEWRNAQIQGESSLLRPSLEVDWRISDLILDGQIGFEWEEPISGGGISRETSYFLQAGIRWEF